jgi:hypothetical protein
MKIYEELENLRVIFPRFGTCTGLREYAKTTWQFSVAEKYRSGALKALLIGL